MSPQIEKQQFQNNTGGWVGVVLIGPRGEDRGGSVEPDGTVWLSEEEQRLTANAPRRPADNPFIEQEKERRNETTGELETYTVIPLTPTSEDRFVPADARPIPGTPNADLAARQAQAAATSEVPYVPTPVQPSAQQRTAEVASLGETVQPNEAPPPPARAAAAVAAAEAAGAAAAESLADSAAAVEAEAPAPEPEPVQEPTPEPVQEPVPAPVEPTPEPPAPEPTPEPQEAPVEPQEPVQPPEETAAQVDPAVGEETGAAAPPVGPAPTGEFQASEEVGTPDAQQQGASEPKPWTPGQG